MNKPPTVKELYDFMKSLPQAKDIEDFSNQYKAMSPELRAEFNEAFKRTLLHRENRILHGKYPL